MAGSRLKAHAKLWLFEWIGSKSKFKLILVWNFERNALVKARLEAFFRSPFRGSSKGSSTSKPKESLKMDEKEAEQSYMNGT